MKKIRIRRKSILNIHSAEGDSVGNGRTVSAALSVYRDDFCIDPLRIRAMRLRIPMQPYCLYCTFLFLPCLYVCK